MVDSSRSIWAMRVSTAIEPLLGVLGALLLDLVLVLQGRRARPCAGDRPGPCPASACLRRRGPRPCPRRAWRRSPWPWRRARSGAGRTRRQAPGRSAFSRDSSSVSDTFLLARPAWPLCAVAMRSCCWVMARRRSSICCTKYFSISPCAPCAAWAEAGQLLVVGLPAVGVEQPLGLLDAGASASSAPMSATTPPIWLVVRISAARLRASAGKMALKWESKEKNTEARHGGQEHHPQHGILDDQAQALHVGRGDVAAAPEAERDACATSTSASRK